MLNRISSKKILTFFIILLTSTPLFLSSSANAAKGYRYWGYFQAAPDATQWTPAMTGPTTTLQDGAVEGWSFSASNDVVPATAPSDEADFATLCADTPQASGKIRVGLVINFGPEAIAPNNEMPPNTILSCALVKKGATGNDVLSASVTVRNDKSGLLCGIEGYPKSECGPEIDMPDLTAMAYEAAEEKAELEENLDFGPILAVALAGLLAIGIAVGIKRRRN
jgi:hypothetical protein